MSIIFGWAARATDWINSWGPIAWVMSGAVGIALFLVIARLCIAFGERIVLFQLKRKLHSRGDAINPMDAHYLNKRIVLESILPPYPGPVDGKTFERCDIVGPLNILPFGGGISGCLYVLTDYITIDPDAVYKDRINNARVFKNCRFIDCKFYNISILIKADEYAQANAGGGCNWITLVPVAVGNPKSSSDVPAT